MVQCSAMKRHRGVVSVHEVIAFARISANRTLEVPARIHQLLISSRNHREQAW
jgi:hypothetical protein